MAEVSTFPDVFSIFDSSSSTYSIFDVPADAFFYFYASFENVHTSFSNSFTVFVVPKLM